MACSGALAVRETLCIYLTLSIHDVPRKNHFDGKPLNLISPVCWRGVGVIADEEVMESLHPHSAVLVLAAECEVGGVDQRLAAVVHQQARAHLVHGVAEREPGDGLGEA